VHWPVRRLTRIIAKGSNNKAGKWGGGDSGLGENKGKAKHEEEAGAVSCGTFAPASNQRKVRAAL